MTQVMAPKSVVYDGQKWKVRAVRTDGTLIIERKKKQMVVEMTAIKRER